MSTLCSEKNSLQTNVELRRGYVSYGTRRENLKYISLSRHRCLFHLIVDKSKNDCRKRF